MGFHVGGGSGDGGGEKVPPGTHPAVLAGIYDLGVRQHPKFGPRHELCLWWETGSRDSKGKQYGIRDIVGANLSPKGWLAKRVAALLGRALTEQESKDGMDISNLVGRGCLITLEAPRNNATGFPLVVGAVPLMAGMTAPRAEGDYTEPPPFVKKVLAEDRSAGPQGTQSRPGQQPQAGGQPQQGQPSSRPALPPQQPGGPSLPPGWRVGGQQDGRTWYVRPDGQSTWDLPAPPPPPPAAAPPPAAPPQAPPPARAPAPPPTVQQQADRQPGDDDVPF